MLGIFLFSIALIGSALASYFDLKTTEIPDEIPYAMMAVGVIAHLIQAFLTADPWPFISSLIVGLGFLGFGFLMYYAGQWGGGDAKILSGIGFLLPTLPNEFKVKLFFPFPIVYFFNLFLVGAVYMIFYAFVVSFIEKKVWKYFLRDLKANAKFMSLFLIAFLGFLIPLSILMAQNFVFFSTKDFVYIAILTSFVCFGLFLLWRFVKTVENVAFKKRIPISKLKVGDVPINYRIWEGITEEELKKIRKSGKKYIWIKEGVRFAPSFTIALLFTLFFGDALAILLKLI